MFISVTPSYVIIKNIQMKRTALSILLTISLFLIFACTENKGKLSPDYIFELSEVLPLSQTKLLEDKHIVNLEFSDSSLVRASSSFMMSDKNFYVYLNSSSYPVLAFDKSGIFCGNVGNIGNGPGEYAAVYDVDFNKTNNCVEVLSNAAILKYNTENEFISKEDLPCSVFSFALDDKDGYWLYTGNSSQDWDCKVVKANGKMLKEKGFLCQKTNLLPMVESNWGKESWLTFHESLSHDLYRVEGGELVQSYQISCPGYEFPSGLSQEDPMKVLDILHQTNYAAIKNYSENEKYIFLYLYLTASAIKQPNLPRVFYWVVNKQNGEDRIVELDVNIGPDSYLFNPQLLSKDNKLYCLGYLFENVGNKEQFVDDDKNPSVVVLDIDKLFQN